MIEILQTKEFSDWCGGLLLKDKAQIDARIVRIKEFEHFGDWKYLGEHLAELRWKGGRRIYFSKVGSKLILLLNGGLKNDQKKDIKKARNILQRYTELET
ncbi:MAG: hypothetical protein HQK52_21380 [Oligoflexia bacterium]|nr:hypothetical protein [Oligoflexia bacterium]